MMKLRIKTDRLRFGLRLPTAVLFSDPVASLTAWILKNSLSIEREGKPPLHLTISAAQIRCLFAAIRRSKKQFHGIPLVDVKARDGTAVLIIL